MIRMTKLKIIADLAMVLFAISVGAPAGLAQNAQSQLPSYRSSQQSMVMNSQKLSMAPEDIDKLKIGHGFLLSVQVLDDADFTGEYRVNEMGQIELPQLGELHVAGDTTSEARAAIVNKLVAARILIDPQVKVSITEYVASQVTILGEVNSPGNYPLLAPSRLDKVMAMAKGLSPLADGQVQIQQAGTSGSVKTVRYYPQTLASEATNTMVYPGDIVQANRSGIVYVLGSVNRPGGFTVQPGGNLTLLQAIAQASGLSPNASNGHIVLLRKGNEGEVVTQLLPYRQIVRGKMNDVPLRAQDVVYVSNSTLKDVLINTKTIIASAISSSIYVTARY